MKKRTAARSHESLLILDNLPLGTLVLRNDFTVVFWNAILEEWTGIPREEMVGRPVTVRYPHLGSARYADRIAPVFEGGPSAIFSSQLHRHFLPVSFSNGSEQIQHTTVTSLVLGNEIHALVSIQDVTNLTKLARNSRELHAQALREIEERKKAEEQLRLAASVFASAAEGIYVTDTSGTILSVNPAFEQVTGYNAAEAVGKTPRILNSGRQDQDFYTHLWNRILSEGVWKGEIWNKRKNGEIYPQEMTITATRDERGTIRHFSAIFSDITTRKKMEEQLRYLSMRDSLSGLFNRRTFDETLEQEWRRAMRASRPFSLVLLDVDFFKRYNDTYGHVEGDACLKAIANVVVGSVHRTGDVTARYGGEEFAVLLPMTSAVDAARIGEKIRRDVESLAIPHEGSRASQVVTVSVGVGTMVPNRERSSEDLLRLADRALYEAKARGRNMIVGVDEESDT